MGAHNETDEQLAARIVGGDKESFSQIVDRYEDKLRRYILRITHRKNEVDDVLQNVFLKAYKNLAMFNHRLKFSSWIYRIAHNESVNLISSSFIQRYISLSYIEPVFSTNVDDQIDDTLIKEQLKNCIEKLELKYKEPLVLSIYEEKSYQEISDIMRIPIKNVGVLIHRAKLKVAQLCNE